eukprot:6529091-Prymnesium_polylepis.1
MTTTTTTTTTATTTTATATARNYRWITRNRQGIALRRDVSRRSALESRACTPHAQPPCISL